MTRRKPGSRRFSTRSAGGGGRRAGGFAGTIATILIFAALAVLASRLDRAATLHAEGRPTVNDGDTITLGGERIRLKGIDAPEYRQTCRRDGREWPCGRRAREALGDMVGGRGITCAGWERDRYGRLLAVCHAGEADINRRMVEEGWAVAYGNYGDAEAAARRAGRGLWAGEFERPRDWRRSHGGIAESTHDGFSAIFNWLRQLAGW